MFTNDHASCDHTKISIIIEQEEIQQFDIDLQGKTLTKVFDDINLTEPIMTTCVECKLELQYDDITIQEFIATPLLDNEEISILDYIKQNDEDGEDCLHEQVSLELYQLVQLVLEKSSDTTYKIKETDFGEKELYLTCDLCSSILYEYFDAELENLNNGSELDEEDDSDIVIFDDDDESDDE
jgi:predicted nucleic-acid-binding Zn-ribbon protein